MSNRLKSILAELEAAQSDLALRQRLDTAEARAEQLAIAYEKARREEEERQATELETASEARFAGLTDLQVTEIFAPGSTGGEGLLHRSFQIRWTQPTYDMYSGASQPKQNTIVGFKAVPGNVLAFLIERHPEQIPPVIAALAPGDPRAAFEQYFLARRRGYVQGAAA